ncbi:trehalose-6-phosphate synthase [Hamadaea sp. NPDC050747]|uniref:trehalose-6-phosphate synthase n=1 Tax=Hamadaea sp. NPDC050747 TaxID=3155789 RepID=UPI0033E9A0DF
MPGHEPARYDLVVATHLLPITDSPDRTVAWHHRAEGIFGAVPEVADGNVAFLGAPSGRSLHRPTAVGRAWLHPAHLPAPARAGFLTGHCAQSLAPTFHGIGRPTFRRPWAEAYQQANEVFAHHIAELAAPSATVWLHDYHLLLAATPLRSLRPDLHIGIQLHSPFPPPELLMRLPDRDQLIAALADTDLIAVAHPRSADNLSAAMAGTPHDQPPTRVIPLGIDDAGIRTLADDPAIRNDATRMRAAFGHNPTTFLSMGRLDAAQGILQRLDAFDALLATGRLDPARTVLAQILTASDRTDDAVQLRTRIEQTIARINGRHGNVGRPVVHYQYRSVDMRETVALYLAADVLLATPLASGTDLTAQEFVAARTDNTGRLVLSELNPTSAQLPEAYKVNPHDVETTIATMATAAAHAHTASQAIAAMRERVAHNDAAHQTRQFLTAVRNPLEVTSVRPVRRHGVDAELVSHSHRTQAPTPVVPT